MGNGCQHFISLCLFVCLKFSVCGNSSVRFLGNKLKIKKKKQKQKQKQKQKKTKKGKCNLNTLRILVQMNENTMIDKLKSEIVKETLSRVKTPNEMNNDLSNNQNPYIQIPLFLEKIVKQQCMLWVDSAINALFEMQENIDYIIKNNKEIKIVDKDNTGIIQNRMKWCDGLHQFLELKHNLPLNCMGLTANFMTNSGLFQNYQRILGLTGTAGNQQDCQYLKTQFKIKTIKVLWFCISSFFFCFVF